MALAAALFLCACSGPSVPAGFTEIGTTADNIAVFAKQDLSNQRLEVRVISDNEDLLCSASGPLDASPAPPICEETTSSGYFYMLPVAKNVPEPDLCSVADGTSVNPSRLSTPPDWPVDFVVLLRTGDTAATSVAQCRLTNNS